MKISNLPKNKVDTLEEFEGIDYGVAPENMKYVFRAFINYSNPIGSIIREAASNSFDAHVEAGQTKPIEIEIVDGNRLTGTANSIIFRDFGPGFSPERIRNIYSKFFSSTKRETNEEIGGYGIGAKAPLAYVDMFTLVTNHEGTKYTYIIHRGEEQPRIELVDKEETDEDNGSEIIINIKEGDIYKFTHEIRNQLAFFDNIIFRNCGVTPVETVKGKHFIWTEDNKQLRVCIGKVTYPVDSSIINPDDILREHSGHSNLRHGYYTRQSTGIVLYFDIGEIDVVWNRETIEYNDRTVEAIKQKIKDVYDEIYTLIREKEEVTYEEWLNHRTGDSRNSFVIELNSKTFVLHKGQEVMCRYLPDNMITDYQKYVDFFNENLASVTNYRRVSNSGKIETNYYNKNEIVGHSEVLREDAYYLEPDEQLSHSINQYIGHIGSYYFTVLKKRTFDEFKNYIEEMKSKRNISTKFSWMNDVDLKKIYDIEMDFLENHCKKYSDIEIPQEYLDRLKREKENAIVREKERIPMLLIGSYGTGSRSETTMKKFISGDILMEKRYGGGALKPVKKILIYDNDKNRKYVSQLYNLMSACYEKCYEKFVVTAITVNKKHADKIEALNNPNYIRATNPNKNKYVLRAMRGMYENAAIDKKYHIYGKYSAESFNKKWSHHPLFKGEVQRFPNVRFNNSADFLKLEDDPKHIDQKRAHQIERVLGFVHKYPLLDYIEERIPEEKLEKVVPPTPINPRLYYLKHLKQQKADETNSDSE